ncbi:MAG TPA: MFS transporter [Nitrososphaera sp.]|nr:MFS transporter [Nitrososphaera sp.]
MAFKKAADSLSIVLLALPTGALADIVDRRGRFIASQGVKFVVTAVLAAMTTMGAVSPFSLFALIFLLGRGEAVSRPAFSHFLQGSIPARGMRSAITLNCVAVNVGRGIGPPY